MTCKTFGVRLSDFGSCADSVPWNVRGFGTKTTQLKGVTQEEEDARVQAELDKRGTALDEREAALKKATLAGIAAGAEKTPRRDVAKERVSRRKRITGLRF